MKSIAVASAILLAYVLSAPYAEAASMYLSPSSGTYHRGQNFTVSVMVNADSPINAVSGALTFPTANVEVIGVNKGNSIIDLWVQDPSFSNAAASGNVQFEGVVLNPGFTGSAGRVVSVVFRVKNEGIANVNFLQFAVLANDGLGTNVGDAATPGRFVIVAAPAGAATTNDVPSSGGGTVSQESAPLLGYWEILPAWLRYAILGMVALATIMLSLIILVFGLIVLMWMWNQAWRRRNAVSHEIGLLPRMTTRFFGKVLGVVRSAEKEVSGDLSYGVSQLKREISGVKDKDSLADVVVGYAASTMRILKRFISINSKD